MLVAFEGIDGSGKTTQVQRLKERALRANLDAASYSFPRYGETLFARCISAYLSGQLGALHEVTPEAAALLYAGDRFESRVTLTRLAHEHQLLLLDRYVASNLAHQGARVPQEERPAFLAWLRALEYTTFGLPHPDLTLYLDMPVALAAELIQSRRQRSTLIVADIHEQDLAYLARCRDVYQHLAFEQPDGPWRTISCATPAGALRSAKEIHEEIWKTIEQHMSRA